MWFKSNDTSIQLNSAHYYQHELGDSLLLDIPTRCQRYMVSVAGRRAVTHRQEHPGVPGAWVRHVHWASEHVAWNSMERKQSTTLFVMSFNRRRRLTSVEELQHVIITESSMNDIAGRRHASKTVNIAVHCQNLMCLELWSSVTVKEYFHYGCAARCER